MKRLKVLEVVEVAIDRLKFKVMVGQPLTPVERKHLNRLYAAKRRLKDDGEGVKGEAGNGSRPL